MNNIIDQTTITTDAIIGTTLDVASGKLKIRSQGITSNEMGNNSVVTAAITDSNITQAKLAPNVAGNGPAFRAYANSISSIGVQIATKVNLFAEVFDTNSNFTNSTFTPTVAGYYLITGQITCAPTVNGLLANILKNGNVEAYGSQTTGVSVRSVVSDIIYLNGIGDYVTLGAYAQSATDIGGTVFKGDTYLSGCLIRSA
jgi:hypothetical protein